MSKNAEGWIRHRGGNCPVEKGALVDVRFRNGDIIKGIPALESHGSSHPYSWSAGIEFWKKDDVAADIMAYRLHKPAEQVDDKADLKAAAYDAIQPLQWRDRIAEIDAAAKALTTERAELVQKLASEGFALIGRVVESVEDYGNIQVGDMVSVVSVAGFASNAGLSIGDIAEVMSVDNDGSLKTVPGGSWGSIGYNYKFHSRPSA